MAEIKGPGYARQPPAHPAMPGAYHPAGPAEPRLPAYVEQHLAVRRSGPGDRQLAEHIQHEGYIRKPPEWVSRQPHDTCPNCGGVNLAAVSSGGYSRPGAPGTILRCFECNWSSSRGVSALWGLPSSGPVVGAAVQSRDGHVSLRNTGLITA